jgi:DNA-binding HxlR family transcriptional regulator
MYLIVLRRKDWHSGMVLSSERRREGQVRKVLSRRSFRRRHDVMKNTPIFIGRWTPKILFSLEERPHRHGELRRRVGTVSQRMFTRTLRNLESTGLIARRVIGSKTIGVEYSLTQLGKTIIAPLEGVCRWAQRYNVQVTADVHLLKG